MAQDTKEPFLAALDELGESEVRSRLVGGIWNARRRGFAEAWLHERERERSDSSNSEQMHVARSAKNAAWVAAIAAIVATTCAIVSIAISLYN